VGKVLLQGLGEDPWGRVVLYDLNTGRRDGELRCAVHGGRSNKKQGHRRSAYWSGQEVKGVDNMQGEGLLL
jgi:hypothetical protein